MFKFNILQKFIIIFYISIAIASCSNDIESTTTEASAQNQLSMRTGDDQLLEEANLLFEGYKEDRNFTTKSTVTKIDDLKPVNFDYYLTNMNKVVESIGETSHITVEVDNGLEEIDIYVIEYRESGVDRSMAIVENKYFDNTLIYDASLVDPALTQPNIQVHEIVSPIYEVNKVRFSSACYKSCIGGIMNDMSIWHIGVLGALCPPCGAAAVTYIAVGVLMCGGGCFVTVW